MKEQDYIDILEILNKAENTELLYQEVFKVIIKVFNANRVQLWNKVIDINEMSVSHEYCNSNELSMIKYRVPVLPEKAKISHNKTTIWEYTNIKDDILNKFNINSLVGIELAHNDREIGTLVITYKDKNRKHNTDELNYLQKIKVILEYGITKTQKAEDSTEIISKLEKQNNKLREQDRLRTNFINNISHELRTPLSSIMGFSKMLITKDKQSLNNKEKEIVDQILLASNRLSSLITDFLEINKIDTEGWLAQIESCDIGEIIKQTVDEFSSLNKKYKITYLCTDDYPIIKTDPRLVKQILDNLISNSIKYSPHGGKTTVILDVQKDKKELKISVLDEGLGIEKGEISKIFSRFYRSRRSEVQSIAGSGLGLAICKEIIATLGGGVEVESTVNKGSKFSFTLPVN